MTGRDPAVEATQRAWDGLDMDVELNRHQPVRTMRDGSIVGCQCMDRVFYKDREDWGSHLAEVCDPHRIAAAREALKPIRERVEAWREALTDPHAIESVVALTVLDDLAPLIYSDDELKDNQ